MPTRSSSEFFITTFGYILFANRIIFVMCSFYIDLSNASKTCHHLWYYDFKYYTNCLFPLVAEQGVF